MTSWLVFVPFVSMAADHCTNPTEYTIDERCYVTDEQKEMSPYNAVVGLIDDNDDIYCTGTIVKDTDGRPYLYTAKHCTGDENDLAQSKLWIKLQDGTELNVTKNKVGDYDIATEENKSGDWAVYSVNKTDVPMVEKTNKIKSGSNQLVYDARVVGYGALKIMSDKEITEFKDKYIAYLTDEEGEQIQGTEYNLGFVSGGIDTLNNEYVINFIDNNDDYWKTLNSDYSRLKVSVCKYSSTGKEVGCQGWVGNSGGPILDDDNRIMGIHTRGNRMIGGKYHAGKHNLSNTSSNTSVNLLK